MELIPSPMNPSNQPSPEEIRAHMQELLKHGYTPGSGFAPQAEAAEVSTDDLEVFSHPGRILADFRRIVGEARLGCLGAPRRLAIDPPHRRGDREALRANGF